MKIWHPYDTWEDYQNGMYSQAGSDKEVQIWNAITLLSDPHTFMEVGLKMVKEWKIASEENLTNDNSNRLAWIGQATCCFKYGTPEILTRIAWGKITERQKREANAVATEILRIYENQSRADNSQLCIFVEESVLSY